MLCRNFELIPIKFGFKVAPKSGQRPCTTLELSEASCSLINVLYIQCTLYSVIVLLLFM